MYGWNGKILVVDLSNKTLKTLTINENVLSEYIGGRGFGVKFLWELTNPTIDAYSADNVLVFAVGPLTSTLIPTTGRFTVTAKSPLTGGIFYSSCGGFFGFKLKNSGLDALIIKGRCEKPVYLQIDDETFQLKDATHLWGKTTKETIKILGEDLGKDYSFACIGPAGENLVRFACIRGGDGNFAGRGGLGAVMGSKKLKAIVVKGTGKTKIADEKSLTELMKKIRVRISWNPVLSKALAYYGTSALINIINEHEILPTKNFQLSRFKDAEKISGEALREKIFVGRKSCYNCPVACKRVVKLENMKVEGPEFETLGSFGSMLMVNSLEAIVEINQLCNELGLDTISTGGTIACAMELSEKNVLDEKIGWGDVEKIKKLIVDIAYRKGLGDKLAEGSKIFSERIGFSDVSMQVKGLELPMYHPDGVLGQALAYTTSNRGGCHLNAYLISVEILGYPYLMDRFSPVNKPNIVAYLQNLAAVMDSMVICKFLGFEFDEETFAKLLVAVTGKPYTQESVVAVGERIWNLERVFNFKAGLKGEEDKLPSRFKVDVKPMLKEYYEVRGWKPDGFPSKNKLKNLGLKVGEDAVGP